MFRGRCSNSTRRCRLRQNRHHGRCSFGLCAAGSQCGGGTEQQNSFQKLFHDALPSSFPARQHKPKATMSTATMVEPTGVPARTEATMPTKAQLTDNTAEQMVTARKFLHRRIAERAGKITSAEISREPTRFIASTMMTAMTMAISRLYPFALVPTACAKSSSKVTANI